MLGHRLRAPWPGPTSRRCTTLRTAIEQLAAARACTRMTAADFGRLEAVLSEMKGIAHPFRPEDVVRLDLAFHDLIYACCEHSRVQRVWKSIRSQVSFFLHVRNVNFPDFAQVGYAEHRELRDALHAKDPQLAREAVAQHMSGADERLKRADLPEG